MQYVCMYVQRESMYNGKQKIMKKLCKESPSLSAEKAQKMCTFLKIDAACIYQDHYYVYTFSTELINNGAEQNLPSVTQKALAQIQLAESAMSTSNVYSTKFALQIHVQKLRY